MQLTDTEYPVRNAAEQIRNTTSWFPSGGLGCHHWRWSLRGESSSSGLASKTRTLDHCHNPIIKFACCVFVVAGNLWVLKFQDPLPWVGLYSVMSEDSVRKFIETVCPHLQGAYKEDLGFQNSLLLMECPLEPTSALGVYIYTSFSLLMQSIA